MQERSLRERKKMCEFRVCERRKKRVYKRIVCKKRLFKRKKKKEYTIEECEGKKRERVYICKKKKRLCEKRI